MVQIVEGQPLDVGRLADPLNGPFGAQRGLGDQIGAHISGRMAYASYAPIEAAGQPVQNLSITYIFLSTKHEASMNIDR